LKTFKITANNGQALTELTLFLVLFAILFFGMDFVSSLVMAKNRADIYHHYLLFRAYRESEGIKHREAPHPDPHHLKINESRETFEGRLWIQLKQDKSHLHIEFIPHFAKQAWYFLKAKAIPHQETNKIYRDPWHKHPIKYAIWALAAGTAIAKSFTGTNSSGSSPGNSPKNTIDMSFLEQLNLDSLWQDVDTEDLLQDSFDIWEMIPIGETNL